MSEKVKWSPEPWIAGPNELGDYTIWEGEPDEVGEVIAAVMEEANAFRIVAAVNACAGISTEALEQGVVKELVEACQKAADLLREQWKILSYSFPGKGEHPELDMLNAALAKLEVPK